MTKQLLLDRPHGRGRWTDTSWYAAHSIPEERLSELKRAVLGLLRDVYPVGLTDDELADKLDEYRYTVAPRRRWLVQVGLVEDSGNRVAGPRKRPQIVWVWVPAGSFTLPLRRVRGKLSYVDALHAMARLHRRDSVKDEYGETGLVVERHFCEECRRAWPCKTREILDAARSRLEEIRS